MSNNPIRIAAVCPTRCWRLAILLYVLGSTVAQTRANSDFPPDDFEVVCLDRATGTLIWRTKPDRLLRPRLILVDDILVAEKNDRRKKEPLGKDRRFFDARTGEMIERRPDPSGKTATSIGPLAPLRRNLEQPDGTCYKYSRGNTRHLIAVIKGESTVVKVLEDYPRDVHIFENLALFTFARAAGEVYAYHLIKDRLVWEFNASKKIKVPEGGYTGISVDGERVLVSTVQTLGSLAVTAVAAGAMLFISARVFRAGLLMYGQRMTLRGVWRAVRQAG